MTRPLTTALCLWILVVALQIEGRTQGAPALAGGPLPGITPSEFTEFRLGLDDFTEVETAEQILGMGEHHLLIVPSHCPVPAHALISVAGGEPGKEDVLFGGRLLRHIPARATLFSVLAPGADIRQQERIGRFLESGERTLRLLGIPVERLVRSGSIVEEILKQFPARQLSSISPRWEDPAGVPISAFIFGGRRGRLAPLVYESLNWQHGVYVAATMASETTAAITGQIGVTRRDPMAMLPFCGYNMGDYFRHWLEMGRSVPHPPKIFNVNWFRKGADGKFLWPGYGENVRVLKWILERVEGKGRAEETPIGFVPARDALTLDGLDVSREAVDELLRVDPADWLAETEETKAFLARFGDRLPRELAQERDRLLRRLGSPVGASR